MTKYVALALALLIASARASTLAAQSVAAVAPTAVLHIHVAQERDRAVPDVELTISGNGNNRTVKTDTAGDARIDGLRSGVLDLRVRRIGFDVAQFLVRVAAGDNEVTVRVSKTATVLDEIRVVGNRTVNGRLEDFDARVARGEPSAVVTRSQIEKRNPIALSQMLRGMAGIRISDSLGYTVAISDRGKKYDKGQMVPCVLRLAVDGVLVAGGIDAVPPIEVYGVEVYFGPSRIPLQFNGARANQFCGLIMIWTRVE